MADVTVNPQSKKQRQRQSTTNACRRLPRCRVIGFTDSRVISGKTPDHQGYYYNRRTSSDGNATLQYAQMEITRTPKEPNGGSDTLKGNRIPDERISCCPMRTQKTSLLCSTPGQQSTSIGRGTRRDGLPRQRLPQLTHKLECRGR